MQKSLFVLVIAFGLLGCTGGDADPSSQSTGNEADSNTSPPTVVINGETKATFGIVTDLVAGDIACYADFETDTGEFFGEMADFGICDQTDLIGTRVELSYDTANVLAAECQGDMDCGKSDTVVVISWMKPASSAPATLNAGSDSAALEFFGRALTGLTIEDPRVAGYFTATGGPGFGTSSVYRLSVPSSVDEMFDTGEGMESAFIIDFDIGGGYEKIFPSAYSVTSEEVLFIGAAPGFGDVLFRGQATDALLEGISAGKASVDEAMIGTFLIDGSRYEDVTFEWVSAQGGWDEIPEHAADEALADGIDPMTGLPLAPQEAVDDALPGHRVIYSTEWLDPGYVADHNQDMDPEWQAVYENDVYLQADFNGDGWDDFAALLIDTSVEVTVYVMHAGLDGYDAMNLESQGLVSGCCAGVGLRLASPGGYTIMDDAGEERFWNLMTPGIEVFVYESSSTLYMFTDRGDYLGASFRD